MPRQGASSRYHLAHKLTISTANLRRSLPNAVEKDLRHSPEPGRATAAIPKSSATSNGAYAAADGHARNKPKPIPTGVCCSPADPCAEPWESNAATSIADPKANAAGQSNGNASTNRERTASAKYDSAAWTPESGTTTIYPAGTANHHAVGREHGTQCIARADECCSKDGNEYAR